MKNRWIALGVIFVSFLQFPLNWFAVVPTFGPLTGEMHLGLKDIGLIVGMFFGGYGLAHIPGGLIAQAAGLRFAILLGILLEALGAVLTAVAPDLGVLLLGRFVCGVGGSIYIGAAIGLTAAWFRDRELVTAIALVTGVAFTIGAAIGLFGWEPIVAGLGWRVATLLGAACSAATLVMMLFLCPMPAQAAAAIQGHRLDLASMRRIFGDWDLWLLGLSFVGGYGAYFTAAELLPGFAQQKLGLGPAAAHGLGAILLFAGIPGSFVGGWLSDRMFGVIPIFVGACVAESLALLAIPSLGPSGLVIASIIVGGAAILGFVVWISTPGLYVDRIELSDIPTAAGLLLTIVAIGGFLIPPLFGRIVANFGYPAGWAALAALSLGTALVAFAARRPGVVGGGVSVVQS